MLTAINVELQALSEGFLPYSNALYIHGLFFNLIKEFDEDYSEQVHSQEGFKPYTLSALKGGKKVNWQIEIKENKKYKFRATFIEDDLFIAFYNTIFSYFKLKKVARVGKIDFIVSKVDLERNETFEEITKQKRLEGNNFNLIFSSPTSFRVNGRNYLFPDPSHILRSYFEKWNFFCPKHVVLDVKELETIVNSCYPIKHRINTELLDMGYYKIVGFKGSCDYEVANNLDSDLLKKLSWLLEFCKYSGTGYKTTMGMGQTYVNQL